MRLNGWRRLGVLGAAIWLLFTIAYAVQQVRAASPKEYVVTGSKSYLVRFTSSPPLASDFFARMRKRDTLSPAEELLTLREADAFVQGAQPELDSPALLAFILGPIVITWLVFELLALTFAWVRRGFRATSRSERQ